MHVQPVAVVTGGSRGIGRGICLELARHGYAVAINYAGNAEAARQTQQLLPPDSLLCQGDVSVAADRQRLLDEVLSRWQRLDLLVNNAGITSVGRRDLLEATEDSWERVLCVNLRGPFFLCQGAALIMRDLQKTNPPPDYRPTIVNISSLSAYALSANRGDYCISKAGMTMLTQLFAVRLAEYGIRVFEVRPGIIATDMTAPGQAIYTPMIAEGLTPIRRWGQPEDVARVVAALATDSFAFSTGEVINVDGGYHLRRFPR